MGHVIIPTGQSVFVEELPGSVNITQLINDVKSEEYSESYRLSILQALGKLGKYGSDALSYLKELEKRQIPLLSESATQAIKKIETSQSDGKWVGNFNHPNRQHGAYTPQTTSTTHPSYFASQQLPQANGRTLEIHTVTLTPLEVDDDDLQDGLKVYRHCNFCEKLTAVDDYQARFSDRLAGHDVFYCNFCIRNDYHLNFSRDVMVLSLRGLVGYYYYSYYVAPKSFTMYLNDIKELVELHAIVGIQNPLFRYDAETMCWFIDFAKVGEAANKMPVRAVLETVVQLLACFYLYENVKNCSPRKLYDKCYQAVDMFYKTKKRMNGDKIFVPTLMDCDIPLACPTDTRPIPVDALRSFVPANLVDSHTRSKRVY